MRLAHLSRLSPMSIGMLNTRQAKVSDYQFLKQLHHTAYRDVVTRQFGSWNDADQDAWFDKGLDDAEYRIVESDGTPVGAIGMREHAGHIALVELQLLPEYQNQGIGTELLTLELKRAADHGLPVRLQVLRQNRARQFYARQNFTIEGETDTHYLMVWHPETTQERTSVSTRPRQADRES